MMVPIKPTAPPPIPQADTVEIDTTTFSIAHTQKPIVQPTLRSLITIFQTTHMILDVDTVAAGPTRQPGTEMNTTRRQTSSPTRSFTLNMRPPKSSTSLSPAETAILQRAHLSFRREARFHANAKPCGNSDPGSYSKTKAKPYSPSPLRFSYILSPPLPSPPRMTSYSTCKKCYRKSYDNPKLNGKMGINKSICRGRNTQAERHVRHASVAETRYRKHKAPPEVDMDENENNDGTYGEWMEEDTTAEAEVDADDEMLLGANSNDDNQEMRISSTLSPVSHITAMRFPQRQSPFHQSAPESGISDAMPATSMERVVRALKGMEI